MGFWPRPTPRTSVVLPPMFTPAITGLALWLDPAGGLSTVDAAIADPNDISTATWLAAGANTANNNPVSFTDTVDGAPAVHFIRQVAIPNLQLNHTAHYKIGVPAAVGGGRYFAIYTNGGGGSVFVDAQTSAIISMAGGNTNGSFVNGVVEFDCDQATGVDLRFYTSPDGINISYIGAGARSVTLGDNGDGRLVTVTQRNVSDVYDQSGNADHYAKAVAAERPQLIETTTPRRFNGDQTANALLSTDRISRVAAGQSGAGAAGTIFIVEGRPSAASVYLCSGASGNDAAIIYGFLPGLIEWYNNTGVADRYTIATPGADVGLHIITIRQTNGVVLEGWYDETLVFGPVVPLSLWNGFRWFGGYAPASNAWAGPWGETLLYNRSVTNPEAVDIRQYLRTKWGTP